MTESDRDEEQIPDDPHAQREQRQYESPVASREHLLDVLAAEKAPLNFEKLAALLGYLDDEDRLEGLRRRLGAMQRDGQLIQNRRGGFVPVDDTALVAGRVNAHPDGFGFVVTDDDDTDIFLSSKQMRQVLHGDRVVVCITGHDRRGRREGRLVDVVERANTSVVGRVSIEQGVILVSPDNKRITQDVVIAPAEASTAKQGDIVVATILEQPTRRHPPVGRIIEVLGEHLEAGMEIDVALRSHDIPFEWPEAAVAEAEAHPPKVSKKDAEGRFDLRELPLLTIDGADARDFDDAVYCEPIDSGWRLLVAIADVAHYVQPDSALDAEAINRGTSVYFPGQVVPMLPEVLSNGLCSINPKVDRLCMVCEMLLDDDASLVQAHFHNGVMRSHARLTYSQVSEILSDHKSRLRQKFERVVPQLEDLHELYELLAVERRRRGAIEFESSETRIVFDDNRKIRELLPVVRNDAHRLIEECMILANIAAAGFLEKHEVPALYRVHHGPKADRLDDLRAFLALRSLELGGGDEPTALDYASLAREIEDRPDRSVIETVMLRSMQQAVYQPGNEGHFGLALSQYAHFTSPIRRYPDLLVHRAIKHVLSGAAKADYRYGQDHMKALGESCSLTERRAEEASRDVLSWLKCEYMQDRIGSEFAGVVSAVTSFGLFVELTDIHVEGLIHITNLSRDYYRFDQAAQSLVGEASGRVYRLGDSLGVRVEAVNLEERKIDFSEVEKPAGGRRAGKGIESGGADPGNSAAGGTDALSDTFFDDVDDFLDEGPQPGNGPEPGNSLHEGSPAGTVPARADKKRRAKPRNRRGKNAPADGVQGAARSRAPDAQAGELPEGGQPRRKPRRKPKAARARTTNASQEVNGNATALSSPPASPATDSSIVVAADAPGNGQAAPEGGAPARKRRSKKRRSRGRNVQDGNPSAAPGNAATPANGGANPGNSAGNAAGNASGSPRGRNRNRNRKRAAPGNAVNGASADNIGNSIDQPNGNADGNRPAGGRAAGKKRSARRGPPRDGAGKRPDKRKRTRQGPGEGRSVAGGGRRRGKRVGVMDMSRPDKAVKDKNPWTTSSATSSTAKVLVKRSRSRLLDEAGGAASTSSRSETVRSPVAQGERAALSVSSSRKKLAAEKASPSRSGDAPGKRTRKKAASRKKKPSEGAVKRAGKPASDQAQSH